MFAILHVLWIFVVDIFSRDAGWKPRTCFFIISLTSH
jgi:hypothetical protein